MASLPLFMSPHTLYDVGVKGKDMHGTSMNLNSLLSSHHLLFCYRPRPPLPKFSAPAAARRRHEPLSLLCRRQQIPSETSSGRRPLKRKRSSTVVRAAGRREAPYEVLGVPSSASAKDIKRAYRRLALKFHPDVNKEANSKEKFMRIKHAYNTLMNSDSQFKYDFSNPGSDYSRTSERNRNQTPQEEEFYGFGNFFRDVQITIADFVRDLQAEYQNWEAGISSQEKPKSLWEELADIGEEFVGFLEKELNINDSKSEVDDNDSSSKENPYSKSSAQDEGSKKINIEDNIDEIEATLVQLKKELGL